ncbi:MAG: metallophosphoesterase family protein [Candidatus Thorarchaeota archaeon]|jgi:predicted phosphodiesterase
MEQRRYALVVAIILVVASVSIIGLYQIIAPEDDSVLNFYVFGDSQGYQDGILEIAEIANLERPDFVFHCGDLTPFGQSNQYEEVVSAIEAFAVPVYTTVGNHDIREGGGERYQQHFGSSTYSFDSGPIHFTIFNTSTNDVSETEMVWLENDLSQSSSEIKFVFTHTPPFDPRTGLDHGMLNDTTAEKLMALFEAQSVNTVFAGHIHMYNESVRNGVRYVITGGAGASLYASESEGGIHHFVNVTLSETGVEIAPVLLANPTLERDRVVIRGTDEDVTLSLVDLKSIDVVEGWSSFQNLFDNWRGYGLYRGVSVSDLVVLVGGMGVSDIVRVTSFDGYSQDFSYDNVYPNVSWYDIQGDMILAYRLNGTDVLDWTDGMRVVMLPVDEAYSNDDCLTTSTPGMGYHIYPSAGARWVRFVSFIEVIPG